ncbi:hypothetical protein [Streptomyces formicae]|uniref:Syndecan 1 n=1 Tax=Streptomyces formicae TaxID=1616117 RepID=A0ABY3WV52_9ACTN|nr:hypothetical protein [Streptomyces formicae]UNM14682.1 hypothetical protein J4032_27360 [Streptomyces formicae]
MAWRDRLRRRATGRPDAAERPRRTERPGAGAGGPVAGGPPGSVAGNPSGFVAGSPSGSVAGGPSGDGPDRSAPGAPGPTVPGDWDGGWRRTAPLELTVARAPLGVSDGLAFRAGLAAWQNPSFDTGLGHALLPTAPTGLVRGVTRPATPQPILTGGGPLLLRALRPEGTESPPGGTADAGIPDDADRSPAALAPQVSRRTRPGARQSGPSGPAPSTARPSRSGSGGAGAAGAGAAGAGAGPGPVVARTGDNSTAGKGGSGGAPRTRGITSADSPAVLSPTPPSASVQRAAEPGTGPVVTPSDTGRRPAAPRIPLVRRVSVVPGAAAYEAVARRTSGGPASETRSGATRPDSGRASRPLAGSGGRTPPSPAVQRTTAGPTGPQSARTGGRQEASRTSGAETSRPDTQRAAAGKTEPQSARAHRQTEPSRTTGADTSRPDAPRTPPVKTGPQSARTGGQAEASRTTGADTSRPDAPRTPAARTEPQSARTHRQPEASRTTGADASRATVRLRPVGPSLTVARRPAGPARRVPALRPAAAPAPDDGTTPDAPGAGPAATTTAPAGTKARSAAPAQRAATRAGSRAPLGAPLGELPSTAAPLADGTSVPHPPPGAGTGSGPALPVVQRHADGTAGAPDGPAASADVPRRTPGSGRSGARARGGLGAPLPALPPSADLPGSAASGARASRRASGPDVQRAPARQDRTPTDAVPRTAPLAPEGTSGGGADAPLLGAGDVQRRLADRSSTGGTADSGPTDTDHGNGPATPLVTPPPAAAPQRPAPEGAMGTVGPTGPAGSADSAGAARPVVVARVTADGTGGARPLGAADPRRLTVTRPGAHSAPAAPRALALLAARPLPLNTRAPEGVAPPAASRSGGRPVVAARWPGAPTAPQAAAQTALARPTPQVQRAAAAHPGPEDPGVRRSSGSPGSVQRVPVVRPTPPHQGTPGAIAPAAAVPARSLPMSAPPVTAPTAPTAPTLTDRPSATSASAAAAAPAPAPAPAPVGAVPVVRPRTATPGPGPARDSRTGRAAPAVQRDVTGAAGTAVPTGVPAKTAPARGRPRSVSAPPAPEKGAARRAETPQDPGVDLDDLARRLLDPVARLLRTELRRGRDRMGRPYDGRR